MRRRQIREALGSEREALLSQLTEQTVRQIWDRVRLVLLTTTDDFGIPTL